MSKFVYNGDVFEKKINGVDYELRIVSDDCAEDPRNYDGNLSHLYCWHSRYSLGDKHSYKDIEDCLYDLICKSSYNRKEKSFLKILLCNASLDKKTRHIDIMRRLCEHGGIYVKYLYLYDHSGITISTSDFCDPWDSGIVGLAVAFKNEIENNTAQKGDNWIVGAIEAIDDEVSLYDSYIRGDTYGFELYSIKNGEEELEDSCGGFLGSDITTNGMLDHIDPAFVELFKEDN